MSVISELRVCLTEMSELLFECYCVPRVAYGIDALFSYSYNAAAAAAAGDGGCHGYGDDALVVSCGYHSTHILPVLRGRLCASACQRIDVGGAAIDSFMQRVLQLKYPQHFTAVTLSRAEVSAAQLGLVAWSSGRALVFGRCAFAVLRSTCS